jgi:hypothetical protein
MSNASWRVERRPCVGEPTAELGHLTGEHLRMFHLRDADPAWHPCADDPDPCRLDWAPGPAGDDKDTE